MSTPVLVPPREVTLPPYPRAIQALTPQEVAPDSSTESPEGISSSIPHGSSESTRPEYMDSSIPVYDEDDDVLDYMPVPFRDGEFELDKTSKSVGEFLKEDFTMDRLRQYSPFFSLAGKVQAPHSLTYQVAIGLTIVIIECMDLHLLCEKNMIFIKPLPSWISDDYFWRKFLDDCPTDCSYGKVYHKYRKAYRLREASELTQMQPCEHVKTWKCLMGFLYSYIPLLARESDFRIACAKGLVPEPMEFVDWKRLAHHLVYRGQMYTQIDERFRYGELNLTRLNRIAMLQHPLEYLFQSNNSTNHLVDHVSRLSPVSPKMIIHVASMHFRAAVTKLREKSTLWLVIHGIIAFFVAGLVVLWMLMSG